MTETYLKPETQVSDLLPGAILCASTGSTSDYAEDPGNIFDD